MGVASLVSMYLPPILGHFKRQYPDITVCLSITDTMDIIERIIRGDLELGVITRRLCAARAGALQPLCRG